MADGKATRLEASDAEEDAGALPEDYRSFLLEHSGGRPSRGHFGLSGLGQLFGIGLADSFDVNWQTETVA